MTNTEINQFLENLVIKTMSSINLEGVDNCPIADFSHNQAALLGATITASAAVDPHLILHMILHAYECGKEYAQIEELERMVKK